MKSIEKVDYLARKVNLKPRIGVVGVGHYTYWGQFPGLLEEMHK